MESPIEVVRRFCAARTDNLDPDGRPGLGARARDEFGVPEIGVAKTPFRLACPSQKFPKKAGRRCRISAEVFVAGVKGALRVGPGTMNGRPRGAPRTTGDDPRCSTWFP
jgi:hypothetical protein